MNTASEVAGDVVSVILVLMILALIGLAWAWVALWAWAQVLRMGHHVRHGAPDYKYLQRLEHLLFIDNVQRVFEKEAQERAERVP